jgi:hypothetical protein
MQEKCRKNVASNRKLYIAMADKTDGEIANGTSKL